MRLRAGVTVTATSLREVGAKFLFVVGLLRCGGFRGSSPAARVKERAGCAVSARPLFMEEAFACLPRSRLLFRGWFGAGSLAVFPLSLTLSAGLFATEKGTKRVMEFHSVVVVDVVR